METGAATAPRIALVPPKARIDEKVGIRLLGLQPNQRAVLRARIQDDLDREWMSYAAFQTDMNGVIDLSSQRPISGTYDDADPMGLFWSMALGTDERDVSPFIFAKTGLTPTMMTFTAEVDERPVACATLERLHLAPGVTGTPVREKGLVGTLFQPAESGSC